MIIILEGPDGAGKTTLAEKLASQTGYSIVHRSKPKSEEEKLQMHKSYINSIRSGSNMIFDRCWYSEMVYGPIMRDQTCISYPEMYDLERQLANKGAIIIYCTGPKAELWKRCTKRGEDYITSRETFDKICDAYETLMSVPHIVPVVRYGYKEVL